MTRAAEPTSVLCKRYWMYEPGKRVVGRGWNARRTSDESRDEIQRGERSGGCTHVAGTGATAVGAKGMKRERWRRGWKKSGQDAEETDVHG